MEVGLTGHIGHLVLETVDLDTELGQELVIIQDLLMVVKTALVVVLREKDVVITDHVVVSRC